MTTPDIEYTVWVDIPEGLDLVAPRWFDRDAFERGMLREAEQRAAVDAQRQRLIELFGPTKRRTA